MKEPIKGRVNLDGQDIIREFESAYECIKCNYQLYVSTGEDFLFTYRNNILHFNDDDSFEECVEELNRQIKKIEDECVGEGYEL